MPDHGSSSGRSSKTDDLHIRLVESLSPSPLNQARGEIEFGMTSNEGSECEVLVAAPLTPGILKHGKVVDINHLYVFLAHVHSEILRQTANQHGIRFTEELDSCSAGLRAKGQREYTPHRTTGHGTGPMDLAHIKTTRPYPASLGDRSTS